MNKHLIPCLKIQFKQLLFHSLQTSGCSKLSTLMLGAVMVIFIAISVMYSYAMLTQMPSEFVRLVPYSVALISVMLFFLFSLTLAQGSLFSFEDFDLLMSLPISKSTILASKLLSFILMGYFYCGLFWLPCGLLYLGLIDFSWTSSFIFILGFLWMPVVMMVISSIFSLVIRFIAQKFRYTKLILNGLTILLLLGYFWIIQGVMSKQNLEMVGFVQLEETLVNTLPFITLYVKAMLDHDLISFLLYLGINSAVLALFVLFFTKSFIRLNQSVSVTWHNKNFKLRKSKSNSAVMALFKKEIKKIFGNFMYFLNLGMGEIILVGLAAFALINKEAFITFMNELYLSIDALEIGAIVTLLVVTCGSISNTAMVSLSLEGKNFSLLKSLPLRAMDIFFGKMLANILLIVIPSFISILLFFFGYGFSWVILLVQLLIVLAFAFLVSASGIVINLLFPKLDFDREILVIKQSVASFVGIMLGLGITALVFVLYFNLNNPQLFLLLLLGSFILIDALLYALLSFWGPKALMRL